MNIVPGSGTATDCDRPGEDTLALEGSPHRSEHE